MWRNVPKPAPTFFDTVTDTKYQLLNNSITVKEFYSKLNEYKIWLEKQKPTIQMKLLTKELINFDNALNLAKEKLGVNQNLNFELQQLIELDVNTDIHSKKIKELRKKIDPYFNNFSNDILMILKYKEEIEKLIVTYDSVKQLENDTKIVRNNKGNLFQIEVKSKKLYIDTGKIFLSWNSYLQLLVYLFFNQKLIEKEDHFIIKTILESTLKNKEFITDSNKSNAIKKSTSYMQKQMLFSKKQMVGFKEISLEANTKEILANQDFMLNLEEHCNELIRKINS